MEGNQDTMKLAFMEEIMEVLLEVNMEDPLEKDIMNQDHTVMEDPLEGSRDITRVANIIMEDHLMVTSLYMDLLTDLIPMAFMGHHMDMVTTTITNVYNKIVTN
uniref:Uncharacterized protein n=1 Tax=Cuerna arida TaxID=1464854 RepID=A0A1B6EJV4_9HEMI